MASVFLVFLSLITIENVFSGGVDWNYSPGNEEQWGDEYPECYDRDESPIDIITDDVLINTKKCTNRFEWKVNETHNRFMITNTGQSISLAPIVYHETKKTHKPMAQFPNYFHPTDNSRKYCLDSFHFHWGLSNSFGSEHEINNKSYPLEAHFVHYACHYKNISHAFSAYANAQDDHVLAVVALLFEVTDQDNKALNIILNDNVMDEILLPNSTIINNLTLNELIPPMQTLNQSGYYYYEGSLTTPPCNDIVRWMVMKELGHVSTKQLKKLRSLMSSFNESIAPNYRELQYNENDVFGCLQSEDTVVTGDGGDNALNTLNVVLIVACSILLITSIAFITLYCKLSQKAGVKSENYAPLEME